MSVTPTSSDKHSVTTSGLGSSNGNDPNSTAPCDVKDNITSIETVSADDSLTLDSPEEEDLRNEQNLEDPSPTTMQTENGQVLNSENSLNRPQKLNNTNIKRNMNSNHNFSSSNGASKITADADTTTACSKLKTENGENDTFAGATQKTTKHTERTESSTPVVSSKNCKPITKQRTRNHEADHTYQLEPYDDNDSIIADKNHDPITTLPSPPNDPEHSSSVETGMAGHHAVRRPRSLTGESTSSSSRKSLRRSGIPCRKLPDHSLGNNGYASTKTTPVHSPSSLHSGVTLASADWMRNPSPSTTPRPSADLVRSSPSPSPSPRSIDSSPVSPCSASFAPTPTPPPRVPMKGQRSGSACETMSVLSASSSGVACHPTARDTVTSRMRLEKHHRDHEHDHDCRSSGEFCRTYLTPYQRKDLTIKDLKTQVQHLSKQLEGQEIHLMEIQETALREKEKIEKQLRSEVEEARGLAETARKEVMSLQESHEESVKMVATLQQQLEDAKNEMARRLAQAEDIFLEMYKKGRESAIFEREEELELQGKGGRDMNATEAELRSKLVRTQAELAKWQTIQRHDSYHTTPLPVTEAEMILKFLKDAVFHFLTANKKMSDEHLRAMVKILKFSEVQREKIAHAIITKRNKSLF